MTKRIIIATHATLAVGFSTSLQFIYKPECDIYTICAFTEDTDPSKAFEKLMTNFKPNDTIIVLTDLSGGSVNKLIAQHLLSKNFYLISGINLALLLELVCIDEKMLNNDHLLSIISRCKEDMILVNDVLLKEKTSDEENFF